MSKEQSTETCYETNSGITVEQGDTMVGDKVRPSSESELPSTPMIVLPTEYHLDCDFCAFQRCSDYKLIDEDDTVYDVCHSCVRVLPVVEESAKEYNYDEYYTVRNPNSIRMD